MFDIYGFKNIFVLFFIVFTFLFCMWILFPSKIPSEQKSKVRKIVPIVLYVVSVCICAFLYIKSSKITETPKEIKKITVTQTISTSRFRPDYTYNRLKITFTDGTEKFTTDLRYVNYTIGESDSCVLVENGLHLTDITNLVLTQETIDYIERMRIKEGYAY